MDNHYLIWLVSAYSISSPPSSGIASRFLCQGAWQAGEVPVRVVYVLLLCHPGWYFRVPPVLSRFRCKWVFPDLILVHCWPSAGNGLHSPTGGSLPGCNTAYTETSWSKPVWKRLQTQISRPVPFILLPLPPPTAPPSGWAQMLLPWIEITRLNIIRFTFPGG